MDNSEKMVVTREEIEGALRKVGLQPADIAFMHSSLSSMGWVEGGAEAVIEAFLNVLDPEQGTLVLPTLCQKDKERRFETWDISTSSSDVGRVTETLRLWPGALRSDHPTHSVAALGARAEEITAGHATAHGRPSPWGPAAFGIGSPWEKLYELNAHYLFLGTSTSCATIGHFAQAEFVRSVLAEIAPERRAELETRLSGWLHEGVWPHFPFAMVEEWLIEHGAIRYADIGYATLRATHAQPCVDVILEHLRTEPAEVLKPDFLDWLEDAKAAREGTHDR